MTKTERLLHMAEAISDDDEIDIPKLVEHYAKLASNPATVEQARHSVSWLMKEWPGVFGDLGKMVKERLDASRAAG